MVSEPMIAVDRVDRMTPTQVKTLKYLSANELVFVGHYPHFPIYPGVFILEMMFQSIDIWSRERASPLVFKGVRNLRLFSPATPGDVLACAASVREPIGDNVIFEASCSCDARPIAKATIVYAPSEIHMGELSEATI